MIDRNKECGACQNLDAYWEDRARHDPELRQRLLQLQKQKSVALETAVEADDDSECPEECLDDRAER